VKTPETAHDGQKAQRRQLLKRLQDERGTQSKQRRAAVETTPPVRGRKALADALAAGHSQALLRPQLREQQLRAEQTETQRALREKELLSSTLQKQQEQRQGELRAATLREEQRRAQQSAAEQARRDEELRAAVRQEQQTRHQAEQRAAGLREKQRRVQQTAAEQAREQAERAAEARKAQRRVQQSEGAQALRNEEIRSEDIHAAELRAARAREQQRRSQQAEAAQARQEENLRATTLREQRMRQRGELRAAELQQERRKPQSATAHVLRDERLQAAELREKQEKQRLPPCPARVQAQIAEKERQEEALRLQAEAQRAAVQDRQLETATRPPQDNARRVRVARNQIRMALAPVTPRGMRAALTATEHVEPEPPAAPLPYLSTSASLLVNENNEPVSLRGVTVRGLDTVAPASEQTFSAALALDGSNLSEMTDRWGVNLVRLAFQAQTILSGNGIVSAPAILVGLDATVSAITEAGAYVLLALEAPPAAGETLPTPDASTTQAWQTLASRYQSESRVLYEIFASPSPLAANWMQSAATLVDLIRQQNPTSIIFLGSGRGGSDTAGLPLRSQNDDPALNIVYTIAVSAQSLPDPDDGHFRALAESYPVFASMWSDDGSDMGRLSSRVADLFGRFGVGWAASTWNADSPLVVDAANHDFTPTGWGLIAQRALSLSEVTSFKPASAASNIFTFRGTALHQLKTVGSFVVDENNNPVSLRGVTARGLDTVAPTSDQTFPAALALDDSNLLEITQRWGVNLIRLPFQAQTVLTGNGSVSAASILGGLDMTVAAITAAGAYVLLALEAPPANAGARIAPDNRVSQVWQLLAERYKANSGVLCELFSSSSSLSANWPQVASTLIATIRQRTPSALIFVGSGNGGSDVSGLPFLSANDDPMFNLVYTIAVSPEIPPNLDGGKLAALAQSNPVFASLWSDGGSDFGRSSSRVPDLFDRYGIGWAASSWNAEPRLVVDAAGRDFTATGWGMIAARAFRLPAKLLLKPFGS
jgi:Cellulase (glycosyl hydrolase family 5)